MTEKSYLTGRPQKQSQQWRQSLSFFFQEPVKILGIIFSIILTLEILV